MSKPKSPSQEPSTRPRYWALTGLMLILVFDLWLRGHAFNPAIRDKIGVDLYPSTSAESEPLDCDEAIYGYIGRKLAGGSVMYRDLTENKPPGGYWVYATAVAMGGANELTIRLLPIPFVLLTLILVWRVASRITGPAAGLLSAFVYALISTDPFLYGESANLEHIINLFSFASIALLVEDQSRRRSHGAWWAASGVCLAAATLVKQTSLLNLPLLAAAWYVSPREDNGDPTPRRRRVADLAALAAGFAGLLLIAGGILVAQGAAGAAFDDIVRYGKALATETPPAPNAPPWPVRWVTGNADPRGTLPWPFGDSDYLVWWGTGTWPIWLAAVPGILGLGLGRGRSWPARLVAAWTVSAWIQVALPRLFWQHYYLLPTPGLAVVFGVFLAEQWNQARRGSKRRLLHLAAALGLFVALGWTVRLQVREYLGVPPEGLVRDRGGPQWLANRALGRELARRSAALERPRLFVWGWQGPLYFYSGLDGVTPQVFVDDFLKAHAGTDHPQASPRIERTMRDLREQVPTFIFAGYPPFPALQAFLQERYLPARFTHGLWIERGAYGRVEAFSTR